MIDPSLPSAVKVFTDVLLFPHFDLHMALTGTPPLTLKVVLRTDQNAPPGRYRIIDQLDPTKFTFSFFAPHRNVGQRLTDLPTVDQNFVVHAARPGVYLFQAAFAGQPAVPNGQPGLRPFSTVGRLQVHTEMVDWWFGNDSVTTALDSQLAHAQPSIYGRFKEDPSGTDVVGDITGHGFITLATTTSADATKVAVAPLDRLCGVAPTAVPVMVTGKFAGQSTLPAMTQPKPPLPVRVVDYGGERELTAVQTTDLTHPEEKCNLVFLAEGFVETDRGLFDRIVKRAVHELFTKPRHEPYNLLQSNFNVFSRFEASQEQQATSGFQVTDSGGTGAFPGMPIPFEKHRSETERRDLYTLFNLIQVVGLPMHGETRSADQLLALWRTLPDFQESKVDAGLIDAWRAHRSEGTLQASDTFFGTYLGARWADGNSSGVVAVAPPPASDKLDDANLAPFIRRLHDFYVHRISVSLTLDPRRHPPELYADEALPNPGTSLVRYLAGLRTGPPRNALVGPSWVPDTTTVKRSRGLVVLVTQEPMLAGKNINDATMVALGLNNDDLLEARYDPNSLVKRRVPISELKSFQQPDGIVAFNKFIDTLAHEIAHSFNLGDEYENRESDDPSQSAMKPTEDLSQDNVSRLGFLHTDNQLRGIDVDKVKWSVLPRMRVSGRMLTDSTLTPEGLLQVTVGPAEIGVWVKVQKDPNHEVRIRNRNVKPDNQQLPLLFDVNSYLEDLKIVQPPVESTGTLVLGGFSPGLLPSFKAGSVVYVPLRDKNNTPLVAMEQKVLAFLRDQGNQHNLPLNVDTDHVIVHDGPDSPRDIPHFKPPCRSARLVGLFEGANHFAGGYYRPTGTCKMRDQHLAEEHGEFCFVCKWLMVNLIDPAKHAVLDAKFYPEAKKNG